MKKLNKARLNDQRKFEEEKRKKDEQIEALQKENEQNKSKSQELERKVKEQSGGGNRFNV